MLLHYNRQYYCIGTLYKICDYMIENSASRENKDESLSVNQVANNVGYGDTFTFSKAFKRHFGKSPSEYRQKGR
jgi:AraC-like DNA-binding protein